MGSNIGRMALMSQKMWFQMPLSLSATAWLEICSLEQTQRHDAVRVQTVSQWVTVTSKSRKLPNVRKDMSELKRSCSERDLLSCLPQGQFLAGPCCLLPGKGRCRGGRSCLHSDPDYSGLIIHFMDSLALCLSYFLRDFWLLVMLLFSWHQILERMKSE